MCSESCGFVVGTFVGVGGSFVFFVDQRLDGLLGSLAVSFLFHVVTLAQLRMMLRLVGSSFLFLVFHEFANHLIDVLLPISVCAVLLLGLLPSSCLQKSRLETFVVE